jgi:hexosaminidase
MSDDGTTGTGRVPLRGSATVNGRGERSGAGFSQPVQAWQPPAFLSVLLPAILAALAVTACGTPAAKTVSSQPVLSLIPVPAQLTPAKGAFVLRDGARIAAPQEQPTAAAAAAFFMDILERTRGVHLAPVAAGADGADITFRIDTSGRRKWAREGYELIVTPAGITVTAGEVPGLFYGGVTLWQLLSQETTHTAGIRVQALTIEDTPRFAWRGLMLDSARHYQSPEFIEAFLDWMALHKLNVLHWHLTDDQGWRLEIKKYPALTGIGAWRVPAGHAAQTDIDPATGRPRLYGGYYSQDTVRRIVAHAAARQITIVPELDMPGHASAAIAAYPWLGVRSEPLPAVPADWGVYANLYNVDERTFAFLSDVLDEVVALFPGRYVHVGGDEAVKDQWRASPEVQARMRSLGVGSEEALQGYFMRRLGQALAARGRRLIGWDEILDGGPPEDATVMSWRGTAGALAAARAGHDTILSPHPVLYFDNRQGTGPGEPTGRGRVVTLEEVYRFEPVPAALSESQAWHVRGLQANLWTEHMRDPAVVAYMAFPRAAAVAETGWSLPAARSWEDFQRRLPAQLARYRALAIPYAQEPAPGPAPVPGRLMSQELASCTDKVVLSLEDDAPLHGPRAEFLVDIMNPCWRYPDADLSRPRTLTAAVGQVPFNFQLGADIAGIHLRPPHGPSGELEVRVDSCEGEPAAALPLDPAVSNDAVTTLPPVALPALEGRHTLCLTFTQRTLDPLWVLHWVQLQ